LTVFAENHHYHYLMCSFTCHPKLPKISLDLAMAAETKLSKISLDLAV
jgi:hypothetical protein